MKKLILSTLIIFLFIVLQIWQLNSNDKFNTIDITNYNKDLINLPLQYGFIFGFFVSFISSIGIFLPMSIANMFVFMLNIFLFFSSIFIDNNHKVIDSLLLKFYIRICFISIYLIGTCIGSFFGGLTLCCLFHI